MDEFKECDWKEYYGEVTEAIPPNAPVPRGKDVDIRLFVDSDHAGDKKTRRSRTGNLIYINGALITWYSKRQLTIESSVFGAEFVALKNGVGQRIKVQATNDGSGYFRTNIHLWRQYVCESQHSKAGFNIEEEVEFHMLSRLS
jgi:hypothetical protein